MGSYFAVDYDRAIGSWTILLLTFGYFRNPAQTQGDFPPSAIDFRVCRDQIVRSG
ncbi:hypothetical protein [Microcoleus sp. CAWBG640]|uniref:hypothetical protein n=1 Tax=Microcoleus sp. CAWBG640 TaxID=2841653 RepID=UPI00312B8762